MCAMHDKTRNFLENHTDIDPIIIDAMLTEQSRPRALVKKEGMLIILRAMKHGNTTSGGISVISI